MMRRLAVLALGGALLLPVSPVFAQSEALGEMAVRLPVGAELRSRRETALGTYALPIGPYQRDTGIPLRLHEGHILRRTWHLRGDATVLQVLDVLRSQLKAQGYDILFQCETRQCGGFDFRFGIEVVPAPDMVVSLSNFHFLSAQMPAKEGASTVAATMPQQVSVLVSRSGNANYIQLIEVSPVIELPLEIAQPLDVESNPVKQETGGASSVPQLRRALEEQGHMVLAGAVFDTGEVALGEEAVSSLETLAVFLTEAAEAQVLIVGHTDNVGGLEENKSLSLRRATAIKAGLVEIYGIAEDRVAVAGAGFMAPIASNLTSAGREKNRRVEVVLLSR